MFIGFYVILAKCLISITPENEGKPKVFWRFHRVQKQNIELQWVKNFQENVFGKFQLS